MTRRDRFPLSPLVGAGPRRLILAAYLLGVLVVMFAPVPDTASYLPRAFDKVVHVGLFLGVGFLTYWDQAARRRPGLLWVVGAGVLWAVLIEVVQALLPYRSGDLADLAAGAAGTMAGAWAARLLLGAAASGS